jgi:XRE family transcriptional regulator, regulator of sulfur utilization
MRDANMTIGQRIRENRRAKVMTLKQLADVTGLTVTYLSDVERDRTQPSLKTLGRVAQGLEITTTDLMSGVDALGDKTEDAIPMGLRELRDDEYWGGQLNDDWVKTLLKLDYRGKRPQTKQDWVELFISLRRVLNPGGEE